MKGTVNEKGELLDALFILFKDLSKKKIKNYLKDGGVLVNGKVVTKYNTIVKKNDVPVEAAKVYNKVFEIYDYSKPGTPILENIEEPIQKVK